MNENSEDNSEQKRKFKFSDTILLGLVPILAYGLLYTYESNYLRFFSVPAIYINFDWAEIFIFTSIILAGFYGIFSIFNFSIMFAGFLGDKVAKERLLVLLIASGLFLICIYFLFQIEQPTIGYVCLFPLLILIASGFIYPFFSKFKGSYKSRLEHSLLAYNLKNDGDTLLDYPYKIFGKEIYILFFLYIAFLGLIGFDGYTSAFTKTEYLIIKGNPECAVVYEKVSNLICIQFDRQSHEFIPGYMIYMNEDLKGVKIENEIIGKLHPKPTSTPTPTPTKIPTRTNTPIPTLTSTP